MTVFVGPVTKRTAKHVAAELRVAGVRIDEGVAIRPPGAVGAWHGWGGASETGLDDVLRRRGLRAGRVVDDEFELAGDIWPLDACTVGWTRRTVPARPSYDALQVRAALLRRALRAKCSDGRVLAVVARRSDEPLRATVDRLLAERDLRLPDTRLVPMPRALAETILASTGWFPAGDAARWFLGGFAPDAECASLLTWRASGSATGRGWGEADLELELFVRDDRHVGVVVAFDDP